MKRKPYIPPTEKARLLRVRRALKDDVASAVKAIDAVIKASGRKNGRKTEWNFTVDSSMFNIGRGLQRECKLIADKDGLKVGTLEIPWIAIEMAKRYAQQ